MQAYYLPSDHKPSIDEINGLVHSANDASALVFLLVESESTYEGCREVLRALHKAQAIVHRIESSATDDPWTELDQELGRATREFQNAARSELRVSGPAKPWVTYEGGLQRDERQTE
jgi:hypothetical protein